MTEGENTSTVRRVSACYYNTWADGLEQTEAYLRQLPQMDLAPRVSDPRDTALMKKARLDCDWYGENARCFSALARAGMEFRPAWVAGRRGTLDFLRPADATDVERWLIFMAHQPQSLGVLAGRVFSVLRGAGVRIVYYAFDEASRFMPCFREIAPHLDVLIHDESPLDPAGEAALRPECLRIHRSWVANVIPFSVPFNEAPEDKIVFLGSQAGLTDHRRRQIDFLRRKFKDRFVASCDHSIAIADRPQLNRFKVGFCPEGRKFSTPAMRRTHTDRPFWSGCLGLVPVSENSLTGDRLDSLAAEGLIRSYPHGDLAALAEACERALAASNAERRRIYEHFNRHETVGTVVANAIEATHGCETARADGDESRATTILR
ncbi:MAG TPA: hypothetical protein VHE61_06855 [Opitutaceae bacterium]|nr:hypothetical protein [Opitutaceae bacterium]